ncbi:MAG: YkgJ family cysteine cluster protein [Desulfobacterales bacterium]
MEPKITPLRDDTSFSFACSPALSCFNACCRDLNQALAPYDILRLKNALRLSSGDFLEAFTIRRIGPETGLPVISLNFARQANRHCPFVTPAGCRVYRDRPASCRLYPLARGTARHRASARISEHFALIREPHCRGFDQETARTAPRDWMRDQGLAPYNRYNDMFLELISLKNRRQPGRLEPQRERLFFTALYDIDSFRELVSPESFGKHRHIDPADSPIIDPDLKPGLKPDLKPDLQSDEIALFEFAHAWVKKNVFDGIETARTGPSIGGPPRRPGPLQPRQVP